MCHVPFTSVARQTRSLGFPPTDNEVRKFLTSGKVYNDRSTSESSYIRARYFLSALFYVAAETIKNIDAEYTPSEGDTKRAYQIEKFRKFMSEGQTMGSSGPQRVNFYHEVVEKAEVCRDCVLLNSF